MTPETQASYDGIYINLDRSVGRRADMEAQLTRYDLANRYGRFSAIDGISLNLARSTVTAGEAGAFISHARVLEETRSHRTPVHILEDDALLSQHVQPVIEQAIAAGLLERFDIVFTDSLLNVHLGMLKSLKAAFDRVAMEQRRPLRFGDLQVIDLAQQNFACMTSYVVGAASKERVCALYRQEMENGPTRPVDLFIRDCVLAGKLRAGLLFPFVTSFRLDEVAASTIGAGAPVARPSVMVLAVLRYLFFMDRDLAYAKSCLDAATRQTRRPTDPHHDMIVQALEFVLSDDFQQF
jgi:GR25 family glycosyltransferase involved in LPS biosynthesis